MAKYCMRCAADIARSLAALASVACLTDFPHILQNQSKGEIMLAMGGVGICARHIHPGLWWT